MDINILAQLENILDAPTCYPEKKRKSRDQRINELIDWYNKYNDINICYNLWGMDCADSAPLDEWLDRGAFRKQRHDINAFFYPNGSQFSMDYTVLMRDKRMFEAFAEMVLGYGNMYSPSLGYVIEGQFYSKKDRMTLKSDFEMFVSEYNGNKLVFKQVFGCSGETVMVVTISEGKILHSNNVYSAETFFKTKLSTRASNWIVQEFIKQHPEMNEINDTSVNTLRIVTYHLGDKVEAFPIVMMRYGAPGALVDNANLGVGVDKNGVVQKYAFSLVKKSRFECHVAGKHIPYFDEAIEFAKNIHSNIPEIFTVGWDICITPDGPHLIEGNDGWDVVLHQAFENCKMRKFYEQMLEQRKEFYK